MGQCNNRTDQFLRFITGFLHYSGKAQLVDVLINQLNPDHNPVLIAHILKGHVILAF